MLFYSLSETLYADPLSLAADIKACVLVYAQSTGSSAAATCGEALDTSLSFPPTREILTALRQGLTAGLWQYLTPFLYHAPADRGIAAQVLTEVILSKDYQDYIGVPIDRAILGLVENLSPATPSNTRAQAILNLAAVARDFNNPFQVNAGMALEQVAYLTTAPIPPISLPPGKQPTVTPLDVFPRRKFSSGLVVAGVVGAALFAGGAIYWSRRTRR